MRNNDAIDTFIKTNKPHFDKFKKYIVENDWTQQYNGKLFADAGIPIGRSFDYKLEFDDKKSEFSTQVGLVDNILTRLKYFIGKAKGDYKNPKFKRFYNSATNIIKLHQDRCDNYTAKIDISKILIPELKTLEVQFHGEIFKKYTNIDDVLSSYAYVEEEEKDSEQIEFYDNKKASLAVYKEVIRDFPSVKKKMESLKIDFDSTPTQTLHILNENPPVWDPDKHFWEQEKKTIQYYADEIKKIDNGVTIDGIHFDGWLYYHINHFRTQYPTTEIINEKKVSKDIVGVPPLRDNEWLISSYFVKASQEQGYALIAATRRAAKTTLNASRVERAKLLGRRGILLAGGSSSDLGQIVDNCKINIDNCEPAFAMTLLGETKEGNGEEYGIRRKDNRRLRHSILYVKNLDGGTNKKKGESLAGFTIDEFILDEAFKFPFLNQLQGLEPALFGVGVMRATPIMTACVCAGTKVWNNFGQLVNVEDIVQEQGILGYDGTTAKQQEITWMKPSHEKPCVRITTEGGDMIECSVDHKFMSHFDKDRNPKFMVAKKAEDLVPGDKLFTPTEIDIWGNRVEKNARLFGLMIGDGTMTSSCVRLSCGDKEIYEFVENKYDTRIGRTFETTAGNIFKDISIRGITSVLKEAGLLGKTCKNKTLPANLHNYTKESVCELIGGYFDADGSIKYDSKKNAITIVLTCYFKELLDEVKYQLYKLGIHSSIVKEHRKGGYKPNSDIYRLYINRIPDIVKFKNNITFLCKHKQKVLDKVDELSHIVRTRKPKNGYKFIVGNDNKGSFFKDISLDNLSMRAVKSVEHIGIKPVYNLTASNTHTYLVNNLIGFNTGGDHDLAVDGIKMLNDPVSSKVILMDWQELNRGVAEEYKTWTERPFGLFLPGQMSIRYGAKINISLCDYLRLDVDKHPNLKKVIIGVTDWKLTLENIKKERDSKIHDKLAYVKELAYHPIDPSEIFLSGKVNPFPVAEAKNHRKFLEESGNWDRRRDLYKDNEGKIRVEISTKELLTYPYKGVSDAPYLIFEDPPITKVPYGTYTGGFDDYKQEDSATDSVATFYVWKNKILGDPFSEKIVASLAIHPEKHKTVHEKWLLLMEAYQLDRTAFGENEDFKIKDFLDLKQLTEKYLAPSLDFTSSFTLANNQKRKFGWTPAAAKRFLFNLFVDYCNETFLVEQNDGKILELKGVQRIDDIYLLDEIISYSENANVDRIIGAMGGYGYIHYLISSCNWVPSRMSQKRQQEAEEKRVEYKRNLYGRGAGRMYGRR